MNFENLLQLIGKEPVFSSGLLLSGKISQPQIRLQLSRWVKAGRLQQIRRGLYLPAPAWRKVEPHPFLVANRMQPGSYVSLQSALAFHGLIPEHVPVVTSVGPGRGEEISTPLGRFKFNHIAESLLYGYSGQEIAGNQTAFIATPEKALLDLVYMTPGADSIEYLRELRLQDIASLSIEALLRLAARSGKPKLKRAAAMLNELAMEEQGDAL